MMSSDNPIISLVTINRNNAVGLEKTINSVVAQSCNEFEYIVIDGASTDASVDMIHRFADVIDYWVSEPDKGIYNAMNKALPHCHGQYVLFLNSGDCFASQQVVEELYSKPLNTDFIIGRVRSIYRSFTTLSVRLPKILDWYALYKYNIPHQATLTRLSLLRELGGYDESLRICSDWGIIFLATTRDHKSVSYIDDVVATIDTTGISSLNGAGIRAEKAMLFQQHFPQEYLQCIAKRKIERFSLVSIQSYLIYKAIVVLRKLGIA